MNAEIASRINRHEILCVNTQVQFGGLLPDVDRNREYALNENCCAHHELRTIG